MTIGTPLIPILDSISGLARRYDAWLADIWGVIHNGVWCFPPAIEACRLFRGGGGVVILISNSPRPRETVVEQLREVGVPPDCYDGIATSGDVTRMLMARYAGKTLFHLGPERDLPIFDDLNVTLGGVGDSAAIVCSGLRNDETETPEDYADLLAELRARGIPMICANPDIKVERGHRLIYCAGALAESYERLGGKVVYAGKPHKPIYDLALALVMARRGRAIPRHRIIAIGDGVNTDIAGAASQKIDSVYVASRVHMATLDDAGLSAGALAGLFAGHKTRPIAAVGQLSW
ncbi:MAG: TIGR01459 family HAD-type hydrolase [Rhodomicrobium sp.]|nr:TIGR01459 family HAD-type hydrolase [Rhodomicrobium sp.]